MPFLFCKLLFIFLTRKDLHVFCHEAFTARTARGAKVREIISLHESYFYWQTGKRIHSVHRCVPSFVSFAGRYSTTPFFFSLFSKLRVISNLLYSEEMDRCVLVVMFLLIQCFQDHHCSGTSSRCFTIKFAL